MWTDILIGSLSGIALGLSQFFLTSKLASGTMSRALAGLLKMILYAGIFFAMIKLLSVAALLACAIASLLCLFGGVVYRYKKGQVER